MSSSFISKIADTILSSGRDTKDIRLVVPGRRASLFIKKELSSRICGGIWLPQILTIEDLAVAISNTDKIENIPLLFEFYEVYSSVVSDVEKRDTFEVFARWAQTLLSDFSEIDRYMLPADDVFATLRDVERIEDWDPSAEPSPMMKSHSSFWGLAEKLYRGLHERLLSLGKGYQGMIFRRAAENISMSASRNADSNLWIFAGLNAMSEAEKTIARYFVKEKGALMLYDADSYYMDSPSHPAGIFLRRLKKDPVLGRDFSWIQDGLSERKTFRMLGVPKQAGQAKTAAKVLSDMLAAGGGTEDTALVLADESLLVPMLSNLPEALGAVNVTMGYPVSGLPASGLAEALISLHSTPERLGLKGFYHKDVTTVLGHGICQGWLSEGGKNYARVLCSRITDEGAVDFIMSDVPEDFPEGIKSKLSLLFGQRLSDPRELCLRIVETIDALRAADSGTDDLTREYLFKLSGIFLDLGRYMERAPYIESMTAFSGFFRQLASSEKISFYGEPLEGLQLMGLLETRLLDFKNLVITGVNEGVLPAGRSDNSFIPYDVKRHFSLPTYSEKDAVYSYHFFRLLQRAENITVVYNTDEGAMGQQEPSRFLLQVKHDFRDKWHITDSGASFLPSAPAERITEVRKTPFALERIRGILSKGLSPSTLNMYMCNPMEFYYRKVLGVGDPEDIEETAAANTMGTVIHDTLRRLYEPVKGREITVEAIGEMLKISDTVAKEVFDAQMKGRNRTTGRNYLILQAVKRITSNFLRSELKSAAAGRSIVVRELECPLECGFTLSDGTEVKLKGQGDRIDTFDGMLRIADYKTGRVEAGELRLKDADVMIPSHIGPDGEPMLFERPKALQVLFYAYMYSRMRPDMPEEFSSGVISLRNTSAGFMPLGFETEKARTYRSVLTRRDLDDFAAVLDRAISEMLSPDVPFRELGPVYYDI